MFKEHSVPSMLGSLHTEDKYIHEFYEARQMYVLKEFQFSVVCLLITG